MSTLRTTSVDRTWHNAGTAVRRLGEPGKPARAASRFKRTPAGGAASERDAAKENGINVFISPHYYYPTDHGWKFEGTLEKVMHEIHMFDRKDALNLEGFEGSGADWLERYKSYIQDGETVVASPHKVYGPETNDLVLQLRKRGIDKVILGGMSANLCVESHMRELLEQGFEVAVVKDATAGAISPELGDGYASALTNYGFLANHVVTTEEAVEAIRST